MGNNEIGKIRNKKTEDYSGKQERRTI